MGTVAFEVSNLDEMYPSSNPKDTRSTDAKVDADLNQKVAPTLRS
jgi:hypothetical protein